MPPIMPMSALLSALRGAGRQHLSASTVAARETITGSHVLRLHRYTQVIQKNFPNGKSLESTTFTVGGHDWRIVCYPNGFDTAYDGHTSLFLKSVSPSTSGDAPTARLQASVLDRAGSSWRTQTTEPWTFSRSKSWGWKDFVMNRDVNLVDDCLTVLCDVTIQDLPLRAEEATAAPPPEPTMAAAPPPFDVRGMLAEAIWSKQPADVTIHVGGETFAAHRWVLEARSPVFKADLERATTYGDLYIDGVDAGVFKSLLQFVYTDVLPSDLNQLLEPLLVAADRYRLEKLKLACGEALCTRVDTGSVDAMAMLALADRYGLEKLKLACGEALCTSVDTGSVDAMLVLADKYGLEKLKLACGESLCKRVDTDSVDAMLALADRYGLEKLKLACGEALCTRVDMGSVGPMLVLAERHGCGMLKEACTKFLSCDGNLTSFMETDGYQQLIKDCPSVAVNIVAEQLPEDISRHVRELFPAVRFHS